MIVFPRFPQFLLLKQILVTFRFSHSLHTFCFVCGIWVWGGGVFMM